MNTARLERASRELTAFLDGPDSLDIGNIIHSTAGATAYGFRGALVGGVTVYGWCVRPILAVLGDEWLARGWADVHFRRPVYPGDQLVITVAAEGADRAALTLVNGEGEVCLRGALGGGEAPFLGELAMPTRLAAEEREATLPELTLETAPVGEDLRSMAVPLTPALAEAYALEKQRDPAPPWTGAGAVAHPGWIAARMTPLIHHSYDYGPAIHTRSQVQHLRPIPVGQGVVVAGRLVDAYERNGHHYGVVDGVLHDGGGNVYTRIRHTTIFRVARRE